MRSGRLNQPEPGFVGEEAVAAEAGVTLATVRVQDPEGRPPAWRAGAIARDHHLRSLADHVPAEPDPRSTAELQPDAGRLADGSREAIRQARRLEHEQGDPGAPGQRRQSTEPVGERGGLATWRRAPCGCAAARQPVRQVDDEQVNGAPREQRAGDRQALVRIRRGHDDEPRRVDAPRNGLDRVERRREVQPRHDPARGLGLRGEPQRQRGPAARGVTAHRHAHPARHAAGPEDRVELREAGREDPRGIDSRRRPRSRVGPVRVRVGVDRNGHGGERPHDLAGVAGSSRAPARPQGRER